MPVLPEVFFTRVVVQEPVLGPRAALAVIIGHCRELFGVVDPAQVAAFVLLKLATAAVRVGETVDCFRGEIKLSRREA